MSAASDHHPPPPGADPPAKRDFQLGDLVKGTDRYEEFYEISESPIGMIIQLESRSPPGVGRFGGERLVGSQPSVMALVEWSPSSRNWIACRLLQLVSPA